jgi:hypothetical protein
MVFAVGMEVTTGVASGRQPSRPHHRGCSSMSLLARLRHWSGLLVISLVLHVLHLIWLLIIVFSDIFRSHD